jgi:hypothetical protein
MELPHQPQTPINVHVICEQSLSRFTAEQLSLIERLIELMRSWTTEQCEVFSTAFAAWNDLIIWGKPATEDVILHEILEKWNDKQAADSGIALAQSDHLDDATGFCSNRIRKTHSKAGRTMVFRDDSGQSRNAKAEAATNFKHAQALRQAVLGKAFTPAN